MGNQIYFMKISILIIFVFTFSCIFCPAPLAASNTDSLLQEIFKLQVVNDSFFMKGQFPAQRGKHKRVPDNTVFYNALISYTLQHLKNELTPSSKECADSICGRIRSGYSAYKNKSGSNTYNFWKTNPPAFFPNSRILSRFSAFNIPDDADCTSMIYLTDTALSSHSAWLQNKLAMHSNLGTLKIKNTCPAYKNFKAYSTWFGKKMPIEFDICVQCNALLFICKNQLPLTIQDQETLALLHAQILSGDYIKQAYYLSPSYKRPAIILYHLARLLENNHIPALEDCREQVKTDAERELKTAATFMDKLLLSTSLLRMKGNPPPLNIKDVTDAELNNFAFFKANLFSSYSRPALKFISKSSWFDCNFYCRAYTLALLLEYEILRTC